jgi:23S rRNA (cytosine1962-C5)-methyltransferase
LQEQLDELVEMSSKLLDSSKHFFILSMYAIGLSPVVGLNVVTTHFRNASPQFGEFFLKSIRQGKDLPMGTFLRFAS